MRTTPEFEFQNKELLIVKLNKLNVEHPEQLLNYFIAIFDFHKSKEVRIYSKLLRPVVGRNYSSVVKELISSKFISKTFNHISGVMSTTYKLLVNPVKLNSKTNNIYFERLCDPSKRYSENSINQAKVKLIEKYKEWINDTTVDISDNDYNKLEIDQQRFVDDIRNNNFWHKTDKFQARTYTPFTSLKKELRKKIKIDGEKTKEADLNSSFCQQIYHLPYVFNADDNFRTCVEKYDVYKYIAFKINCSRDDAKRYFNFSLNSKVGGWQHPVIVKLFPKLFSRVNNLKKRFGNSIISRILFRYEAKKVIEIADDLMKLNIKHFTIHDGFIVKAKDAEAVQKIILQHNLKSKIK